MSDPAVCILLTTYQRTDYAVKTIQAVQRNLQWPQIWWYVSDDGSSTEHVNTLLAEIGPSYNVKLYDSARRGVGHGMNACLREIFRDTELVMILEDDWVLDNPMDLRPYVNLLVNHAEYGMVRFGYTSAGLLCSLVSEEGKLLWKLEPNNYTYRYSGHPSLRHRRFHEQYGYFAETLTPGYNELDMAGKVNALPSGPAIVLPADYNCWGAFGHIGTVSMKDSVPAGATT